MIRLINDEWMNKIQETWKNDSYYAYLIENCVLAKAQEAISRPGIWHEDDTNDYWRCMYRVTDTALALAFTPDNQEMRKWLHDAVMEICAQPDDMWIGPFFRHRTNPPQGQLETTTMQIGLFKPLVLCPDLFTEEDRALIIRRIREVGKPYTREWLDARDREGSLYNNNWTIAMLHGYTIAGILLEEDEILEYVVNCFNALVAKTMNSDFYGEATAYWGYAASSFSEVTLLLRHFRPDMEERLAPLENYARMLPWYAAHYVGEYYIEASPEKMERWINISDSDAMGNSHATLEALIATSKDRMGELAPLAAALHLRAYTPERLMLKNAKAMTFRGAPTIWSILLYPYFADPKGAPVYPDVQRFNNGETFLKRENGLHFLSNAGSTEPIKAIAHRHADEGVIFAAYKTTVLLDDPGRCCYRLPLYEEGKLDTSHSLPFFASAAGEALHQRILAPDCANIPPLNYDAGHKLGDDWFYTTSDMGPLYPETMDKVQRNVLALGDHAALVEDSWQAKEPIQAGVRFVGNNRMALMRWQIKGNEGRLAREKVGVRLISLEGITPTLGYGTLNDASTVNPAGPTQGRQGTAYHILFNAPELAEKGKLRTLLIFDDADRLDRWSASQEGDVLSIRTPEGELYASVATGKILWHGKEETL